MFNQNYIYTKMTDKLYFYSRSKDCTPGKGVNEVVSDPSKYAKLPINFRRVLSNFHVCKFVYSGSIGGSRGLPHMYNTIEHAYHARKIGMVDPEKALWFTVDSGHEIGASDGFVAQKNRKLIKLDEKTLKVWDSIKHDVMKEIAIAKYTACDEARVILEATGDAELWHIVVRKKPVRFVHLEEIRTRFREADDH
jgi:predicted NAD-dependent protein-ADP-ribosyltransferase YbiA (DUF1768 family)